LEVTEMQTDEFIKHVSIRGEIHSREDTENAIKAVFQTLRDRIVHDTGDNIKSQLPKEIQGFWETGLVQHIAHKFGGRTRMDLSGFIGRVGDKLDTDDFAYAERITRAVITTLRQSITPGAQEEVERELPEDLREFWRSCLPPEMPMEADEARRYAREERQMREQEGPPFEMGAPVPSTPEEEAGVGPWVGAGTCQPCAEEPGLEEVTEIEVTEMRQEVQRAEHEVHPPAEERMEVVPPPEERVPTAAGPGSVTHYRSDPQLEQEIRQMLEESNRVEAEKIDVFVQAGNVTLRGHAKNQEERDQAGHIAAKALGVGDILNEITVEDTDAGEGI
jgi:uncharacterized protein (DUF2267 family)